MPAQVAQNITQPTTRGPPRNWGHQRNRAAPLDEVHEQPIERIDFHTAELGANFLRQGDSLLD